MSSAAHKYNNTFLHAASISVFNPFVFLITAEPVPVGCQSDDECPLDKACHNTLCIDPCNCGINAECSVINHKPLCYCPPGYSGDPEVECQKCKQCLSF